jgi:hypothetical protein
MATIKELKEAQQGYLAARLAVEKTKPARIKRDIIYEIEDSTSITGKRIINSGVVSYDPEHDYITIKGENNGGYNHIEFKPIAIPLLINALRELIE